ncbi:hypothetical protein GGH15_000675 [Coemansia sp. RSA 562]|nr:hypothetical protein GGH15_000675 [Coemansia sp. RSA 562]
MPTDVAPDAVANIPNGLLLESYKQTFCQVMIVSSQAGVAAASCFKFDDDGYTDPSTYTVIVGGGGIDGSLRLYVTKIEKHPNYNPNSFANNLAIVTFGAINNPDITYQIGDIPSEWPGLYFVHRSLIEDQFSWNDANIIEDTLADSEACGAASPLFRENNMDFICNMATRVSFSDGNCVLPYKYVVGHRDTDVIQLGFYSHSAIKEATGFCNGENVNTIYNYYILLANYIPWINSKISTPLTSYHFEGSTPAESTTSYSMKTDITYSGDEPKQYSLHNLNEVIEGSLNAGNGEQVGSDINSNDNPNENVTGMVSTTTKTVYSTKYKTEYDSTTVYEATLTTTTTEAAATSTTTVTDVSTKWSTKTSTTTETSTDATITTTVYNDAFTIVYETETETVTESKELTVTLSDGSTCPTVSDCKTSYIGPGQVEVITTTVTEVSTAAGATVTVTENDNDDDDDDTTYSSFVAVTVTVADTTVYATVTMDAVTETVVVTTTEEPSDGLSGLDSNTNADADDNAADSTSDTEANNNDGGDDTPATNDPDSVFLL